MGSGSNLGKWTDKTFGKGVGRLLRTDPFIAVTTTGKIPDPLGIAPEKYRADTPLHPINEVKPFVINSDVGAADSTLSGPSAAPPTTLNASGVASPVEKLHARYNNLQVLQAYKRARTGGL